MAYTPLTRRFSRLAFPHAGCSSVLTFPCATFQAITAFLISLSIFLPPLCLGFAVFVFFCLCGLPSLYAKGPFYLSFPLLTFIIISFFLSHVNTFFLFSFLFFNLFYFFSFSSFLFFRVHGYTFILYSVYFFILIPGYVYFFIPCIMYGNTSPRGILYKCTGLP